MDYSIRDGIDSGRIYKSAEDNSPWHYNELYMFFR